MYLQKRLFSYLAFTFPWCSHVLVRFPWFYSDVPVMFTWHSQVVSFLFSCSSHVVPILISWRGVTNSGCLPAPDKDMLSGTHDGRERERLKTYYKMRWQCPFYTKAWLSWGLKDLANCDQAFPFFCFCTPVVGFSCRGDQGFEILWLLFCRLCFLPVVRWHHKFQWWSITKVTVHVF